MKSSKWKRFGRASMILIVTFVMVFVQPLTAMAEGDDPEEPEEEEEKKVLISDELVNRYNNYQIMFYSRECYNIMASLLPGDDRIEKIWNYIVNAGISGISDNPAAIAGILGNMSVETGGTFNPFKQNSNGCTGLIQWCPSPQPAFFSYMDPKFSEYYFVGAEPEIDEAIIDEGIIAELDFLFEKVAGAGGATISKFSSKLDVPTNRIGVPGARGYADLFLVTIENAYGGADSIEDSGVAAIAAYDKYQGANARRSRAVEIYNKYADYQGGCLGGGGADGEGTGVTWSGGWINADTFPGYTKEAPGPGWSDETENRRFVTGGPNKILLHSTEGQQGGLAAYPSGNHYAAHFTLDAYNKRVSQHYSIDVSSNAIKSYDTYGPIQIEIVGFSQGHNGSGHRLDEYTDEMWDYIALLVIAISERTGIPLTTSVDWASPSRISKSAFRNYSGIIGHMHAPDNDHVDPGNIWPLLSAAFARNPSAARLGGCGNTKKVCL